MSLDPAELEAAIEQALAALLARAVANASQRQARSALAARLP
jgi:hypothetical protein